MSRRPEPGTWAFRVYRARLSLAKGILRVEVALLRLATQVVSPVALDALRARGQWGAVDVERHRLLHAAGHDLRVYVGGVDQTRRVRFFDDRPGQRRAELYVLDADGRVHVNRATGEVVVEVVNTFEVVEA